MYHKVWKLLKEGTVLRCEIAAHYTTPLSLHRFANSQSRLDLFFESTCSSGGGVPGLGVKDVYCEFRERNTFMALNLQLLTHETGRQLESPPPSKKRSKRTSFRGVDKAKIESCVVDRELLSTKVYAELPFLGTPTLD